MIPFWVLKRFIGSRKVIFNLTSLFAILGMALGVASLVVTMSVVSGYESALKGALVDYAGHLNVVKRGGEIGEQEKMIKELPQKLSSFVDWTPFVQVEALIAHDKKISGVLVEGLQAETVEKVLNLKGRIVKGQFLTENSSEDSVVIGQGVAKRFNLKVGDPFRLVRPISSRTDSSKLYSHLEKLRVVGIIDLGKFEYNERVVLSHLAMAQKLKPSLEAFSGIRIRIKESVDARDAAQELSTQLGYPYSVRSWQEINRNLLEAIELEKPVIFFVILIIVVAACFNICSHLFVNVIKKYSDVSVIRTLGASRKSLILLFSIQGLFIGLIGVTLGIGLGWAFGGVFEWIQVKWGIIPGKTYKLAFFGAEMRLKDVFFISVVSLLICFFSTLPPAIRGSRITPIEGLRYE